MSGTNSGALNAGPPVALLSAAWASSATCRIARSSAFSEMSRE
jgi:hypothetical protein